MMRRMIVICGVGILFVCVALALLFIAPNKSIDEPPTNTERKGHTIQGVDWTNNQKRILDEEELDKLQKEGFLTDEERAELDRLQKQLFTSP